MEEFRPNRKLQDAPGKRSTGSNFVDLLSQARTQPNATNYPSYPAAPKNISSVGPDRSKKQQFIHPIYR
jgi:hypothetical protein